MYIPEGNEEYNKKAKQIKIYPYQGKHFAAKSITEKAQEREGTKPRRSWFSVPLRTISKGLDYLYTFNPLEALESVGGAVRGVGEGVVGFGKDIAAPGAAGFQRREYERQTKQITGQITALKKRKESGKISPENYKKSLKLLKEN